MALSSQLITKRRTRYLGNEPQGDLAAAGQRVLTQGHPRAALRIPLECLRLPANVSGMVQSMCRNIRTLANFEPPATTAEVQAAARQYVRKVSGTTSQANEQAIQRTVDAVADATAELLDTLVFSSPPRDRESNDRNLWMALGLVT